MRRFEKRIAIMIFLGFLLIPANALAQNTTLESGKAVGVYRHPDTGLIEDSGGEANEALGSSMVKNVVDENVLIEEQDGLSYLSLRFHLTDSISDIKLYEQGANSNQWNLLPFEITAKGNDTKDYRFRINDRQHIFKAECAIIPMGRSVVFFITVGNFAEGNSGNFAKLPQKEIPVQEQDKDKDDNIVAEKDVHEISVTNDSEAQMQEAFSKAFADAKGLDIGETQTKVKEVDNTEKVTEDIIEDIIEETQIQELLISRKVWIMLFIVFFSANLIASIIFWGIKTVANEIINRKIGLQTTNQLDKYHEREMEPDDFSVDELAQMWETEDDKEAVS